MVNDLWKVYKDDFNELKDSEVQREVDSAQELINENTSWLEAVASWVAAGKPREAQDDINEDDNLNT